MGRCAGVKEAQTRGGCTLSRPTRSLAPSPHAPLLASSLATTSTLHSRGPSTHYSPHGAGTRTTPPSADVLGDLHSFDPATMTWTLLSAADDARRPSARAGHGFTSAGGLLYVHGGSYRQDGAA